MGQLLFPIHQKRVAITGEPGIDLETAINCAPFKRWVANLEPEIEVRAIHMQSMDMLGRRVGFLKFKAEAYGPDGSLLPSIVFMRGAVVVVFVVIVYKDLELTLRTEQVRVPFGRLKQPEMIAGMVDPGEQPVDAAVRELEEAGIKITSDKLVCLNDEIVEPRIPYLLDHDTNPRGFPSSPDTSDEEVWYYLYRTEATDDPKRAYDGKESGAGPEERKKLIVSSVDTIWRYRPTAHTLACLFLYNHWKQRNNL